MEPRLISVVETPYIGLAIQTRNTAESNPATAKIPGLWGKFFTEKIPAQIPCKAEPAAVLGVYREYVSGHTGDYTLVAACGVTRLSDIPDGMTGGVIPTGHYMLFEAQGEMPQTIVQAWRNIWNYFSSPCDYERSYATDFEFYKDSNEIHIYISVNKISAHD